MSSTGSLVRRVRPDRMTLFFIALAAASAAGAWLDAGGAELLDALGTAGTLLLGIAPVIIVALFLGGYVQALLPHKVVARWLGENGGTGRYLLATAAGALTPAGPFGAFPLVVALRRAGTPFDVCVVYLTAWSLIAVNRTLLFEVPMMGARFTLGRIAVSLPLPFLAGGVAALMR